MGSKAITFEERQQIEQLYNSGSRPADIAVETGLAISSVYRELKRGLTDALGADFRRLYSAEQAQTIVQNRIGRGSSA